MDALIEARGLTKTYGERRAVQDVSFAVPRGAIYGVLGPNGAGKSSTMRMLVGVITPTAGEVLFDGAPLTRQAQRRIGFLPEERGLYRAMTPRAAIVYFARLKGVKAGEARRRARALLAEHGLADRGGKKIRTLSKGMAQKVQLLAAIAHAPDLMVLDEPFSGLDPVNQQSLEQTIRAHAAAGHTVVFSTHVMEHAERMCDRILLIAKGRMAFEGQVADALAHAPRSAVLETEAGFDLAAALAPAGFEPQRLGAEHGGPPRWRVALTAPDDAKRLLTAAIAVGAPLTAFEPPRVSLHEAFVALVGPNGADVSSVESPRGADA
jgi:ABC-2 type transport system ATP-binding protein